jgi:hypothetical protein
MLLLHEYPLSLVLGMDLIPHVEEILTFEERCIAQIYALEAKLMGACEQCMLCTDR